jgi:hypothetical protein
MEMTNPNTHVGKLDFSVNEGCEFIDFKDRWGIEKKKQRILAKYLKSSYICSPFKHFQS